MKRKILILTSLLLLVVSVSVVAQRIKKHGGLLDVNSSGDVVITPFTGRGTTVTGKLNTGLDAGANDTYAITLTPALGSYVTGQLVIFKANTANTGAATLNVNGLGAKTIKKVAGGITTDLATGDILAGQYVAVMYDGTNMQMLSASGIASQASLTNPVVGVGSGYKVARGVTSITGSGDVVTGLTTVVSVTVTPQSDLDGTTLAGCSGTIGNQAGAPAAGSVTIKCFKITAADNGALIAADAAKSVNWIAVGT